MWRLSTAVFARLVRPIPLGLAALAMTSPSVRADIPRTIAFSGTLTDAAGNPRPNGTYTATLSLYDAPSGGNLLWSESNKPLTVSGGHGVFVTALGSTTSLNGLDFNAPYYVQIQVGADAPMAPRLPLQTVPYAVKASGILLPYTVSGSVGAPGALFKVSNSSSGSALFGEATGAGLGVFGSSASNAGVFGQSAASYGVDGTASGNYAGVGGFNTAGLGVGVYGQSAANAGVYGASNTSYGLYGESLSDGQGSGSDGVHGVAHVPSHSGVFGENNISGGFGVYGNAQGAGGIGVFGTASGSASSRGVFGSTLHGYAVYGEGDDAGGIGVYGQAANGAYGELGTNYVSVSGAAPLATGAIAAAPTTGGYGIVAIGGYSWFHEQAAGLFAGDVKVYGEVDTGTLYTHGSKNFRIDDPLDPANKTLIHSCAEGPEPLDLYKGHVTTDATGTAVVPLPDYFEALNKDFEYHLTCIGQFAQAIVSEEVHNNTFTIKTDKPNVKVSWQVIGVRNDAYMRTHPRPVEEMKSAEQRGRYLDPESYGLPAERGILPAPAIPRCPVAQRR